MNIISKQSNKLESVISLFFKDKRNSKKIIPKFIDVTLLIFAIIVIVMGLFNGLTSFYFSILQVILATICLLSAIENYLLKERLEYILLELGIAIILISSSFYTF
ncbi:putative membrane protein required for colicin V production [Metabacillus crassostreae]|nr:putative membrane protein required for colicin V production [Metabacillus crassostreae]